MSHFNTRLFIKSNFKVVTDSSKLIIIDSNSLIHRAFHALPPLTTKGGEPVGAVYGFCSLLFRILRDFQPEFVAPAFDMAQPTFRHQAFADYKAKRTKAPDEFYQQLPKIKDILRLLGLTIFEKEGFEADDVIGSIAKAVQGLGFETIILSSDKDVLQLVDNQTKALLLKRGVTETILYDEEKVAEAYQGLTPSQLIDFKALRGDPSDNIPGVFGVGEKTALMLINRFSTLTNLYQSIETGQASDVKESLKKRLLDEKDKAFLSRRLAEIDAKTDIEFSLDACRWKNYNRSKLKQALEEMQFFSLLKRVP